MPRVLASRHSVTSIRSVRRNGPTRVSQSKVVPTPSRRREVKRMATASSIQATWEPMSRTDRHTVRGGAWTTVLTRTRATWLGGAGLAAECLGGQLWRHDVQQHAGAELEAGPCRQLGEQVDVPVVVV